MNLSVEVRRLLVHLDEQKPGTDEYDKALDQLNKIIHMMVLIPKDQSWYDKVFNNPALIGVIGNGLLMFMMLNYERAEIITTRALNYIRPK